MILEYLSAITLSYILIGIAIALIEINESRRLRDVFGGTLLINKTDLMRIIILWLPMLFLPLVKNKGPSKIKP